MNGLIVSHLVLSSVDSVPPMDFPFESPHMGDRQFAVSCRQTWAISRLHWSRTRPPCSSPSQLRWSLSLGLFGPKRSPCSSPCSRKSCSGMVNDWLFDWLTSNKYSLCIWNAILNWLKHIIYQFWKKNILGIVISFNVKSFLIVFVAFYYFFKKSFFLQYFLFSTPLWSFMKKSGSNPTPNLSLALSSGLSWTWPPWVADNGCCCCCCCPGWNPAACPIGYGWFGDAV